MWILAIGWICMYVSLVGKKEFNFTTMAEFMAWKDKEE